jgi:glucokinase
VTTLALGVDVGGTKIASGLVDQDGNLVEHSITGLAGRGYAAVEQLALIINDYLARTDVAGIGLAVPGAVRSDTRTVTSAPNLDWNQLPLGEELARKLHIHEHTIHIENDANAAAWAEHRVSSPSTLGSSTVLLTVGTGIGGGLIVGDCLVRGWTGGGGEVGHLPLLPGGRLCECGSRGCWEQYASGRALTRAAQEAGWRDGRDVLSTAAEGDTRAREVVSHVAAHLVHGIRIISALIDPARLLIGGGLGADERFLPFVRKAARDLPATAPRGDVTIETAALGMHAGVIGAALLGRSTPITQRAASGRASTSPGGSDR